MAALTRLGPGGTPIAAVGELLAAELTATIAATETADAAAGTIELVAPVFDVVLDDIVIPNLVLDGSTSGLLSDTSIVETSGGLETRRCKLIVPRETFTLHYKRTDVLDIQTLFRTQQGPLRVFLIDDIDDNVAVNVELVKTTILGVTVCQLRQQYESLSVYTGLPVRTAYMPVYRVKSGTLTVTVDNVSVTSPADYTEEDGVLTFEEEVTDTVRASFGFYKVVRFADDVLDSTWIDEGIRELRSLKLISEVIPSSIPFGAG